MTDWTNIHPDFTDELQAEWEEQLDFETWQVEEWIKTGLEPKDSKFIFYLLSIDYEIEDISEGGSILLNELREKFDKNEEINDFTSSSSEEENEEEIETRVAKKRRITLPERERDWTNINSNFTPELIQEWKSRGFEWKETKDWMSSGMKVDDAGFCAWLRDEVKFDSDRVLNYEYVEDLHEQYQDYLSVTQQIETDH